MNFNDYIGLFFIILILCISWCLFAFIGADIKEKEMNDRMRDRVGKVLCTTDEPKLCTKVIPTGFR